MSSKKLAQEPRANGFILAEKFHVTMLPEAPLDKPDWWHVEILVQVRPAQAGRGDDGLAEHAAVFRPVNFIAERESDKSD